jgi:hypothetical protein
MTTWGKPAQRCFAKATAVEEMSIASTFRHRLACSVSRDHVGDVVELRHQLRHYCQYARGRLSPCSFQGRRVRVTQKDRYASFTRRNLLVAIFRGRLRFCERTHVLEVARGEALYVGEGSL